MTVIWAVMGRI